MKSSLSNSQPSGRGNKPRPALRLEQDLVENAFRRMARHNHLKVCLGVPLLGRCIDLAFVDRDSIVTIEFKMRDWRRALRQAKDHQLGADYCYICMPLKRITAMMRKEFLAAKVGLAFFAEKGDWPFDVVIDAPKSADTWEVARSWLWSHLDENGGGSVHA